MADCVLIKLMHQVEDSVRVYSQLRILEGMFVHPFNSALRSNNDYNLIQNFKFA